MSKITSMFVELLGDCIVVDKNRRCGVPVLRNTRFPVAQLFVELAEGRDIQELSDDLDLDIDTMKDVLRAIAKTLDQKLV